MNRRSKTIVLAGFCIIANLSITFSQETKRIPPERPKIVVTLLVEQMRHDYIQRYWDKLGDDGFKRLINEGTYYRNASFGYLLNHTGVGVATIVTGSQPSTHGIIADEWYNHLKGKTVQSTEDETVRNLNGSEVNGKHSPMNLFGSTISDELRLSNNLKSRVYSIALNEKAAVLGGGHLANSAWWFDIETGTMMTSSFYKQNVPGWVTEFNSKKLADIYLDRNWELTLPIDQYTESLPEPNAFKIPFDSRNTIFPYELKKIRGRTPRYDLLPLTPFGNTFTKDFALSLLVNEELGRRDQTDFLFLSFSANSNIGHRFGILSMELQDAYIQLDKDIAHFLSFIDENYGKESVLIVFTSDRGANHHPGYLENIGFPSGTLNQMQAMILLRSYLNASLGNGDWIKGYHSRQIYLNHQLIEDSKLSLVDLQEKVARFMIQLSGISAAVPSYILQQNYFGSGWQHKMQNGYNQKRSGDVIIALQPGWNERNSNINSSNTLPVTENHVPLVLFGWKMNRFVISRPVDITGIAPTLAILLGISSPQVSTGQLLQEVIR
jgi:predicted AlkP superfamily pyrophosphatase or phosphodiesterase